MPAPDTATAQPAALRVCTRCVMDTTDPDITFDAVGMCSHCHDYDQSVRAQVVGGAEGLRRLDEIVGRIKRDGAGKKYDCIIGVSGGVDSTYVAYKVKQLGLRPLAVHLDNGWNSEVAVSNISVTLKNLGIDLYTHVIDWEEFKDIQLAFLRSGVPDCEVPSDQAIFSLMSLMAAKHGVQYVITGCNVRTETHLPQAWSQGQNDWLYIRSVHRQFGSGRIRTYPHLSLFRYITTNRLCHRTVNILDYLDYSKNATLPILERELGWKDYGGKHFESVYTRWYQGYFLPGRFGYDKRKCHLSSRLCSGELTRAEAMAELAKETYPKQMQEEDCAYVRKKFGLSEEQFQEILNAPRRTCANFPSYRRIVRGPLYRAALRLYQFVKYGVLHRPRAVGA